MGMESIKQKRELSEEEFNDHFKDDKGVRNVSKDFANSFYVRPEKGNLSMLYSLGKTEHYAEYLKNSWPEISDQIIEKSNKKIIEEIDKFIDLYNSALEEKKDEEMLSNLKKIFDLVNSIRE